MAPVLQIKYYKTVNFLAFWSLYTEKVMWKYVPGGSHAIKRLNFSCVFSLSRCCTLL